MITATINASTGSFQANFVDFAAVRRALAMVLAGAQVNQSASLHLHDHARGAGLHISGACTIGLYDAVSVALGQLENMRLPARPSGANYDVVVPVRLALAGDRVLVDAEDFVRNAMELALTEDNRRGGSPATTSR